MQQQAHIIKTDPKYFERVAQNHKRFELRKNDRGYRLGDILILREYDERTEQYTGRVLTVRVKFLTDYPRALKRGYVAMSLSRPRPISYDDALRLFERINTTGGS
ncbi:MAG: DUF3850 domain-containing protein [Ktedonobacteraceae bacterium]